MGSPSELSMQQSDNPGPAEPQQLEDADWGSASSAVSVGGAGVRSPKGASSDSLSIRRSATLLDTTSAHQRELLPNAQYQSQARGGPLSPTATVPPGGLAATASDIDAPSSHGGLSSIQLELEVRGAGIGQLRQEASGADGPAGPGGPGPAGIAGLQLEPEPFQSYTSSNDGFQIRQRHGDSASHSPGCDPNLKSAIQHSDGSMGSMGTMGSQSMQGIRHSASSYTQGIQSSVSGRSTLYIPGSSATMFGSNVSLVGQHDIQVVDGDTACTMMGSNGARGLTAPMVAGRLAAEGPNVLQPPKRQHPLVRLLVCMCMSGFSPLLWVAAGLAFAIYPPPLSDPAFLPNLYLGIAILFVILLSGTCAVAGSRGIEP
jgi:hypothetical protein